MKNFTLSTFAGILFLFNSFPSHTQTVSNHSNKLSSYSQMVMDNYKQNKENPNSKVQVNFASLSVGEDRQDYIDSFIRFTDKSALATMQEKGVILGTVLDGIATVKLPVDLVNEIAAIEAIHTIEFAQPFYTHLDSVRKSSNITPIHQGLLPLSKPYKGNGVIVGMVDVGFDFTHPNYYDATGTNYRIQKVWA